MNTSFKQRRARIGALTLTLAALFGFTVLRLVILVAFDGARLNSLAKNEHTGETQLAAVRGPIVDRNGEPLALSAETRSVYARPKRMLESSTLAERQKLAAILGIGAQDLETKIHKTAPFVWLVRRIASDKAQAAEVLGIDGVGALSEYKRFFPLLAPGLNSQLTPRSSRSPKPNWLRKWRKAAHSVAVRSCSIRSPAK